jgi:threonine synthase
VEAARRPTTLASAIRIAAPAHAAAVAASGAEVLAVSDAEIVDAWRELGRTEGLFCEPASAAGLAAVALGLVEGSRVVVTITGHGLKDPETAAAHAPRADEVDADPDAIAAAA